jgi:hypothetical protein
LPLRADNNISGFVPPMKGSLPLPRTSIQQRINQLDERKRALKARLGKQERREDTRRKILIGALVLHRLEHSRDAEFTRRLSDWLVRELPGFLTRDGDKALFGDLIGDPSKPVDGAGAGEGPSVTEAGSAAGGDVG